MSTWNPCKLLIIDSSVLYYKKKKNNEDDKIWEELVLLAEQHQTWGFWTMHHRLRNQGFGWNHKRVYRVYRSLKLKVNEKTDSGNGKRALASTYLSQCDVKNGFYERYWRMIKPL